MHTNSKYHDKWTDALRIVHTARPWFKACRDELDVLLKQSDNKLRKLGLGEPLCTDLGSHRWLRRKREENYSDWLAWVIGQLSLAEMADTFAIERPTNYARSTVCLADRERWILDRTRRVDLVICFGDKPLVVVEIKRGLAQDEKDKLTGYRKSPDLRCARFWVLLGTARREGETKEDLCGFEPRRWDDVCVALRRVACGMSRKKKIIVGAMILAFVGAVEQNLLGFSIPSGGAHKEFSADWPLIADHVRRSLHKGGTMKETNATLKNEFLIQGAEHYSAAARSIEVFEQDILDQCKKVLKKAFAEIPQGTIGDWKYHGPDFRWLGVKAPFATFDCTLYSGLRWNSDRKRPGLLVISSLDFGEGAGKRRKRTLAKLQRMHQKIHYKEFDPELAFFESIDPTELTSFEDRLAKVVGRWAVALKAAGGPKALFNA